MGTKQYSAFQSELLFELGNRTDLDNYKAGWIDTAYLEFCTIDKILGKTLWLPELDGLDTSKATTDGGKWVLKPSDSLFIHTVKDTTNDKKLDYQSIEWYWEQEGLDDASSEGKPDFWIPYGNKIYFQPTPDAAYNLEIPYRKRPAAMSANTDTTAVGEEWDEAILKLAVIQSLRRLKQYDRAALEEEAWMVMMRRKLGIYDAQTRDQTDTMRPDWSYLSGFSKYR